jgi:hypothetical protein
LRGKDWLEEGLLVPAKKDKREGLWEKVLPRPKEEVRKNYVPPFVGIPVPPSCYGGVPMQAWGSGVAIPPPNFVVPNVALAAPYAYLPQPQQNVATIGRYAARNMQIITAIQTNANQMGEGNANTFT